MKLRQALLASALVGVAAITAPAAFAQSLSDVLSAAYNNNPTLLAARASLRATDEGVPQALSGWRPTVSVTGSVGEQTTDYSLDTSSTKDGSTTPRSLSLTVSQPLYRGGRTEAATNSAEALVLVDALLHEPALRNYHLLPGVRADLLSKLGRTTEARAEFTRAAAMTQNERERRLLLDRAASA